MRRLTFGLWVLALSGACREDEPRNVPLPAEVAAQLQAGAEARAAQVLEATAELAEAEAESAEPDPEAEPENGSATDEPESVASRVAPEELEETAEMMEEAMEAAASAEGGASLCDAAYDGIAAMAEVVRQRFPDRTQATPPRALFLDACHRLPEAAQQCLLPSYAVDHRAECTEVQAALPAADRDRLQNVLTGA